MKGGGFGKEFSNFYGYVPSITYGACGDLLSVF